MLHGKESTVPRYAKIQSKIWGYVISKRTNVKMTADGQKKVRQVATYILTRNVGIYDKGKEIEKGNCGDKSYHY